MKLWLIPVIALPLMAAKCEPGSNIKSDASAYCQTHYNDQQLCEADDRCVWTEDKGCKVKQ